MLRPVSLLFTDLDLDLVLFDLDLRDFDLICLDLVFNGIF